VISDLWYKNAIIYCLSVGSFMDANGDGVGDFSGLMRRLDYLHGLGVTAIWLMSFQPSPIARRRPADRRKCNGLSGGRHFSRLRPSQNPQGHLLRHINKPGGVSTTNPGLGS
jgi:hypothetical protein